MQHESTSSHPILSRVSQHQFKKKYMDEIIFKPFNPRNRIMLELMARGAMRIGEVLKIRPIYVQDHKITLPEPKSGNEKV
jgi:integrase/recombinase XerD